MNNKYIIFSDFDGTISKCDILDKVITDVYSFEIYKEMENKLLTGNLNYETYLFHMFNNINYNLGNFSNDLIDEYFFEFYEWIIKNNIDFYIVSSGFKSLISFLLPYVNPDIIYANDIIIDDNKWSVKLYDKLNNLSINKNELIKSKNNFNYKTIFIGDGLSDFKVMGNVDYLFCKKNSLLHIKCIQESCNHIVFENFGDIINYLQNLIY